MVRGDSKQVTLAPPLRKSYPSSLCAQRFSHPPFPGKSTTVDYLFQSNFKMLDVNDFITERGGNPEAIRDSQRRRFASVEVVDEVIALFEDHRKSKS